MNDRDTTQTIFMSGPAGLARILDQNQKDTALWGPDEMRAMWRHQLRAPLDADLSTVQSANLAVLRLAPETSGFLDKSFENLLHNAKPSLSLLKVSKQFAKLTYRDAEDPQLKEIAAALYYACYAVGMVALTAWIVPNFSVHGFWDYVGVVFIVWVVNWAVGTLVDRSEKAVTA